MLHCALFAAVATAPVALRLPTFVDSHMVLQRAPMSARLWGWSAPGSQVRATLNNNISVVATTGAAGNWSLDLPPQDAGTGHEIVVSSQDKNITLFDVVRPRASMFQPP